MRLGTEPEVVRRVQSETENEQTIASLHGGEHFAQDTRQIHLILPSIKPSNNLRLNISPAEVRLDTSSTSFPPRKVPHDKEIRPPAVKPDWKDMIRGRILKENEKALLQCGECFLVGGVSRDAFLAAAIESDEFTRGLDWRATDHRETDVGDIFITHSPTAAHEMTVGALERAFTAFVDRNAANPLVAREILSVRSVTCSSTTRIAQADGGFYPKRHQVFQDGTGSIFCVIFWLPCHIKNNFFGLLLCSKSIFSLFLCHIS